jgi:hypothetical protein
MKKAQTSQTENAGASPENAATPPPAAENAAPVAPAENGGAFEKPPVEPIDPLGGPAAQELANAPAAEVTAETIAKPLAENMPPVTENAQLPGMESAGASAENAAGGIPPDKGGKAWDALKYKVDALGQPRRDAAGYFIPLDKGRPPSAAAPAKKESVGIIGQSTKGKTAAAQSLKKAMEGKAGELAGEKKKASDYQNTTGTPDEYDLAAKMYFKTALVPLVAMLSDEWNPDNEGEEKTVVDSIACFLRARGSIDLTPGQALCFACACYAAPRLSRPKTRDRLTLLFLKVRGWFSSKPKL